MRRLETLIAEAARADAGLGKISVKNFRSESRRGACNEAKTLAKVFGSSDRANGENRNMKFIGLDVRAREIAERLPGLKRFEFPVRIHQRGCHQADGYRQLSGSFDVIFMRHRIFGMASELGGDLHKALEKLSPNGRLIITSYFDREHEQAIDVIKNQGGQLLVTEANKDSRKLPFNGKSVDRHIAVEKEMWGNLVPLKRYRLAR